MTAHASVLSHARPPSSAAWRDVVAQLERVDAWAAGRRAQEQAIQRCLDRCADGGVSSAAARELALSLREREALLDRIDADKQAHDLPAGPTVVLAVRSGWTGDRVCGHLVDDGVRVLAVVRDGAGARAALLYDQPSLLLVEPGLPALDASGLIPYGQRYAPTTHLCLLTDVAAPVGWSGPGRSTISRRQDPSAVATGAARVALRSTSDRDRR